MALVVGDGGEGRTLAGGDDAETSRDVDHPVAVAHPDLLALAGPPDAVKDGAIAADLDEGTAELTVLGGFDATAELIHHGLLAIADAQHRHTELEDPLGRPRRTGIQHRGRAARQDHRLWCEVVEHLGGLLEGHDLAIDAALAHAPGNQLGDLGAEIDDQNAVAHAPEPIGAAGSCPAANLR